MIIGWICLLFLSSAYSHKLELISVGLDGKAAGGCGLGIGISDNGRFVLFASSSPNIVNGDTNHANPSPDASGPAWDIFLRDKIKKETIRVSVQDSGKQVETGHSYYPSMSGDAKIIAYQSQANDIVPGDPTMGDTGEDIYVYNMETRHTDFITQYTHFREDPYSNYPYSYTPKIARNGRYVYYLVRGRIDCYDLVNKTHDTVYDQYVMDIAVNANGRYIAFLSGNNIAIKDMEADTLSLVSISPEGGTANGRQCFIRQISDDGRFVLYETDATNILPGKQHVGFNCFIYDRIIDETILVSLGEFDRPEYKNGSRTPSMSADGRYVVFSIYDESFTTRGLYRFDRITNKTVRLLTTAAFHDPDSIGFGDNAITPDGKTIVFISQSSAPYYLHASDVKDVFLLELDDESDIDDWPLQ